MGHLAAQQTPAPVPASDAGPLPGDASASGNTQTPGDQQAADNSQATGIPQVPTNPQAPVNPSVPNTPLLPQQGLNPFLPQSASASDIQNTQSAQITAPSLYATGTNDLSLVSTNAALAQAFSEQGGSNVLSDQGLSYSHPPIERIRLGPFDLKSAVTFNAVSDDNLTAGAEGEGKLSDTSFGLTPAVLLEYGTHEGQRGYASLIYAPTFTRFLHHSDENSDNQNVAFAGQYPFQKLTLDVSETYSQVTGINQDISARTTQTSSLTTAGGSYDIDDKISVSSHVEELITKFSGGQGSGPGGGQAQGDEISSINNSLFYHLSDKMTLGPSLNIGQDKPENVKEDTFEQALVGVNYRPTEKISLFAQGGAEFREGGGSTQGTIGGQGGNTTNPIFSAGVGYTPFDSTTLSVNASQDVRTSTADAAETVVNTGVGFSASQRFLQVIFFNFNFSYAHTENQTSTGSTPNQIAGTGSPSTTQDSILYRPSISYNPTSWTSIAIYYQYLDNKADNAAASYHDNQMGVSISARF